MIGRVNFIGISNRLGNTIPLVNNYKYTWEEKFFLFYFPLINILFFSFIDVIPEELNIDIIRGIIAYSAIFYFLQKHSLILDKPGKILLAFTIFVIIMSLYTFIIYNSLDKVVFKIIVASFFYFIGAYYVRENRHLILMLNTFYYSIIIILSSILIFKLFDITVPDQYQSGVELGAQGVNTTKIFPILFLPLLLTVTFNRRNKIKLFINFILITVSIIIIILGMKRGTVFGLSLAFLSYLIFSGRKLKASRIFLLLALLTFLASTFFWETIVEVYSVRSERYEALIEERYEEEARYNEMLLAINNISIVNPLSSLFGYGFRSEFFVYNVTRMFHTDYMTLLHGTGIFGLFLFIYFYFSIFKQSTNLKIVRNNYILREIRAISIALIIYLIFIGASGSIHEIDLRGFALLFWGGSLRFMRETR